MTNSEPEIDQGGSPNSTSIRSISGILLEDQERVRACVDFSDLSQSPTVELALLDPQNCEITRAIILGVFNPHLEFTLHLGKYIYNPPIYLSCVVSLENGRILIEEKVRVN